MAFQLNSDPGIAQTPKFRQGSTLMKRKKPDILIALAFMLGLGVTLSSLSQGDDDARKSGYNAKASGVMVNSNTSY
jgi:hypothetical protein